MRQIRPALWVFSGTVGVLVGLAMTVSAAAAATRFGDADEAPRCVTDFDGGCTTERRAVLQDEGYVRYRWLSREQKWLADVPQGAPELTGGELQSLVVPRQDGRAELAVGTAVTVIYFGRSDAWIRLPSGRVLETDGHPRRSAPQLGWFALFAVAAGVFGIGTGVRSGRGGGGWLRKTDAIIRFGPAGVLAIAAMAGALAQTVAGSSPWPGLLAGAVGGGLGVLRWRRDRRRRAAPV